MAIASITALILLIVTILFIGFAIFSFIRAFLVTRNRAYLHIGVGIVLGFFADIFSSIVNFYPNGEINKGTVLILVIIANICFSISIFSIFNGLIFIREDKLPIFSYIAALLIGATTTLITSINTSNLLYDEIYAVWKVDYLLPPLPISYVILLIISQIILLTYLILYLIRKIQKFNNNKNFDIGFIAIFFLAIWGLTPFITELKTLRFFLFPVSLGLLGLAVFIEPLNLLVTNVLPSEIILVTKHRQPVIRYNVQNNEIDRNIEEVQLLIAGKKVISESLKSPETPKTLKMKAKEIKVVEMKNFNCYVIERKIDKNCISATYTAFREFNNRTNLEYLESDSVINEMDEKLFLKIFLDNFKRIDATKRREK